MQVHDVDGWRKWDVTLDATVGVSAENPWLSMITDHGKYLRSLSLSTYVHVYVCVCVRVCVCVCVCKYGYLRHVSGCL